MGRVGLDNSDISASLPPAIGPYFERGTWCHAFARVTYRAGAGVCYNCRVASNSTVQNDTALELRDDAMTVYALRFMPDGINDLVLMNSSIPSTFGNFEDYVTEVLIRSYSGAWTALHQRLLGTYPMLTSGFTSTFPALRAKVNLTRVYVWLGIQLLVTSLGILYLLMHSRSENPLLGDTSMIPFYLDTTDLIKPDAAGKVATEQDLMVESKGDHWKILDGSEASGQTDQKGA